MGALDNEQTTVDSVGFWDSTSASEDLLSVCYMGECKSESSRGAGHRTRAHRRTNVINTNKRMSGPGSGIKAR